MWLGLRFLSNSHFQNVDNPLLNCHKRKCWDWIVKSDSLKQQAVFKTSVINLKMKLYVTRSNKNVTILGEIPFEENVNGIQKLCSGLYYLNL